ncbi:hypothetical protein BDN67DRAFT_1065599 [Paxillus ammoniavirescens]|nr:hypothetical protein BDN67DRAFT_1065599 [Paxillus ammoniavirescens]
MLRALSSVSEGAGHYVIDAPCYRLSTVPENLFPAALQDLAAAYDYLISKGYQASNITISGDSGAGGKHALLLTYLISQSNRTLPTGIVTIAPAAIQSVSTMYIRDSGFLPEDGLVPGAYIPFTNSWPKTLIMVGTGDQSIDASRELKNNLKGLKTPVEYDRVPHGWWAFPGIFPEDSSVYSWLVMAGSLR